MTLLSDLRQSRRTGRIVWTVFALFALRAIVPVGYMPAAIDEGGPFVLCQGVSAATLAALSPHDSIHGSTGSHGAGTVHHAMVDGTADNPGGSHDERWERCELGTGSASAAMAAAMPVFVVVPVSIPAVSSEAKLTAASRPSPYRARAPPA